MIFERTDHQIGPRFRCGDSGRHHAAGNPRRPLLGAPAVRPHYSDAAPDEIDGLVEGQADGIGRLRQHHPRRARKIAKRQRGKSRERTGRAWIGRVGPYEARMRERIRRSNGKPDDRRDRGNDQPAATGGPD